LTCWIRQEAAAAFSNETLVVSILAIFLFLVRASFAVPEWVKQECKGGR
jgi:hypothetical protein